MFLERKLFDELFQIIDTYRILFLIYLPNNVHIRAPSAALQGCCAKVDGSSAAQFAPTFDLRKGHIQASFGGASRRR